MPARSAWNLAVAAAITSSLAPVVVTAAEGGRQIEEVIVTAERREASISDTSISMTAFDSGFLRDFGLRNQEDLQNYIPATTIQPYDITIRGVGRTSRTLGGDPGVATYFNGVYSEDFGIASTEGGLFDMERIEVLRGPQGTLYGRNAVGGAVNFISRRPTDELEVELQSTVGNFNTIELSGILSGPIIEDVLNGRLTYTRRRRDGYIDDTSPFGNSINDYGDENVAIALEFKPTDRLSFYVRANDRDFDRKFNGGAGTSPVVVGQGGDRTRDTTSLAFGWKPAEDAASADRTFINPATGAPVFASRIRPGVDANAPLDAFGVRDSTTATSTIPNYAIGLPDSRAHTFSVRNTDASDFLVDTNGQYEELFDHNAAQFVANYDHDNFSVRYTFGYTSFLYERTTDEDKTGNVVLGSYDFYTNQENDNWQHELQVDFSLGERISVTSGLFVYNSQIDQRLDLYDPIDVQGRFQDDAQAGALSAQQWGGLLQAIGVGVSGRVDINSARQAFRDGAPLGENGSVQLIAPWFGDRGTGLPQGPLTDGTFFAWNNTVETRAYAAFSQGVWDINDQWSLTAGLRYARDDKKGTERLFTMLEVPALAALTVLDPATGFTTPLPQAIPGFIACPPGNFLCVMNVTSGALDPTTLEPAGLGAENSPVRFNGPPTALSSFLPLEDDFDVWTWRLNLDYVPAPGTLLYASATTGWKSGGFNLGFNSTNNPIFKEENVLAFELGYKGLLRSNTVQLNASVYSYLFDDRQTFSTVLGQFGVGSAIINIPDSRVFGAEADFLWNATDSLTLGGNGSYTRATIESNVLAIDNTNPRMPGTLFTPQERTRSVDGNRLPLVPDWKFTAFGIYSWRLDQLGSVELRSSLSWTDSFFSTIFNDKRFDQAPAFARWDARVAWTSVDEAWDVSLFVNNIMDKAGVRQFDIQGELQGDFLRTVTLTDPRVWGATVSWSLK
ncbi:MAG: TonB-dependent receptor [Pseudomonadales bacterium]